MNDVDEELPFHPETAPEHRLVLRGVVGEVVGVEDAVGFVPLPRLALAATRPRATTPWRLRLLGEQGGEAAQDEQVLGVVNGCSGILHITPNFVTEHV